MKKEDGLLFPRILLIALVAFFLNIINLMYRFKKQAPSLTGFSVVSKVGEVYSSLPTTSKLVLFLQLGVFILILLYAAFKDRGVLEDRKELDEIDLKETAKQSETDLDTLYKLLKEKNKLRISTIAKAFKINKDLAMEWGKTLEEGGLAIIDYPRFTGPVLKLKLKKIKLKNKLKKVGNKKAWKEKQVPL
jgi:hypothetical protein